MTMQCLVYDLHAAQAPRYAKIDEEMKKLGGAKLFNTTWFFPQSVQQATIASTMKRLTVAGDWFAVFTASGPKQVEGMNQDWKQYLMTNL